MFRSRIPLRYLTIRYLRHDFFVFIYTIRQGNDVNKSAFIAFYQGDQLKVRVKKICEGYHAALYPCPESMAQRRETTIGVHSRIEDLKTVLDQTNVHRSRVLEAASKHLRNWIVRVRKMKVPNCRFSSLF